MLRFHTAYSSSGVKNYFSAADYYADGPETVGFWWGKLAPELGLERGSVVQKEDFAKLCDNRRPDGSPLTLRTNEFRRVGEDMIFSLNKDVSAFIMLAEPAERDALLAMVQQRVLDVCDVIEADVETRVRRDDAFENRAGGGLAFAGHLHTTARPVADYVPDPHVHWHMFAFNATRDGVEGGRVKAADFANIYRDSAYYESLFNSLVAYDFARLYAIEQRPDGKWGLAGLQPLVGRFSKRTEHIEAEAKRLNITDPAIKDGLGATTRRKKDTVLSREQLRAEWQSQLSEDERDALAAAYRREIGGVGEVTPAEAVRYAVDHLSEKLSVIPERELKRVALIHGLGSVTPDMIDREMKNPRHGLIVRNIAGQRLVTTGPLQNEERYISGRAAAGRGTVAPVGVPEGLTRRLADGKELSDEQYAVVTGLLESENACNVFIGPAGAGKSWSLQKYDEAMRLAGQNVTYLATTSDAVGVLQKDGFEANTVQRFLLDTRMQEAARGGEVVIDEISMLGHRGAFQLFKLAEKLDLKLVLVGDPMQMGSVDRGALVRLLSDYGGLSPFKVTQIFRQQDLKYRAAAQLLSEGQTLAGFNALDARGFVREVSDDVDRYRHAAADYVQALADKKSVILVSPTHFEANRITQEIRSQLRDAGKLGKEDFEFTRFVAVDTSTPQRAQVATYRPGDVIQFHQNAAKGFIKGQRIIVTDPAKVPMQFADKFTLYRPERISLAAGDILRFTSKVKTLDGKHTLRNGSTYGIAAITDAGNIKLSNGWVVDKSVGHFRLGWVDTSFSAEGKTLDRAIVVASAASGRAANQEMAYTASSRAREKMTFYVDDKEAVRDAISRTSQKLVALDLAAKPNTDAKRYAWIKEHLARQRRRSHFERPPASRPITRPLYQQPERELSYGR